MKDRGTIERIRLRGPIGEQALAALQKRLDTDFGFVEITLEGLHIVPKALIEMLESLKQKRRLVLKVTSMRLYSYLHQLNFYCELLQEEAHVGFVAKEGLWAIVIGGTLESKELIESLAKRLFGSNLTLFITIYGHREGPAKLFEELQGRSRSLGIRVPQNGERIEKGRVYLLPVSHRMVLHDAKIVLEPQEHFAFPAIEATFDSVAQACEKGALGILSQECGNGDDEYLLKVCRSGMPVVVHRTDDPSARVRVEKSGALHRLSLASIESLVEYLTYETKSEEEELRLFLKMVYMLYGYDFSQYDTTGILRRIRSSMEYYGIHEHRRFYHSVLLFPKLFESLFLTISVGVTEFFRKPQSLLGARAMLEREFQKSDHFKVWIAGFSSGQEAYTMGMLLADTGLLERAVLYATDFNAVSTQIGRNALYALQEIGEAEVRARSVLRNSSFREFFEINRSYGVIKPELRKRVLFFEHNLATDSSFNEFMMISCKNVLIYFSRDLQLKVMELLYSSLKVGGFLLLGSSESLPYEFKTHFIAYDIQSKIYKKIG